MGFFEDEVYHRLRGKPHLSLILTDVHNIAGRLREVDPSFFVVWNSRRQKYEVHSSSHQGNTYGYDVANNRLDARVIEQARKSNLRTRGDEIFADIDAANARLEEQIKRQRANDIRGIAEELHPYFRRMAWEV